MVIRTGTAAGETLFGSPGDDALYGRGGDDILRGQQGDDLLDGGAGIDLMIGRQGDDLYFVDASGDRVVERAGEGLDEVRAAASYVLRPHIENLVLLGMGDFYGFGNAGANRITGNDGANFLDGRGGADRLDGGLGDDVYVYRAGTTIVEAADGGTDLVIAFADAVLAANVERLWLRGDAADATGNALDNIIRGNGLANLIDGGAGRDIMIGGGGNDTYVVDHSADKAIETAEGGVDTVESSVNYTLGAHVENLILTGLRGSDARGNALDNIIEGNDGNNRLIGGAGADILRGGGGNDSYYVDNVGDVVEDAEGRFDIIYSSVSYALPQIDNFNESVENLTLLGTADIDGTGNGLRNIITGNSGDNVLTGASGDTLIGGGGDDTLIALGFSLDMEGGAGHDTIELHKYTGNGLFHHIADFNSADDSIGLAVDEFTGISVGVFSSDQFVSGTEAGDANDRVIYDVEKGQIYFDSDGSGQSMMVPLGTVQPGTELNSTDFFGF